MRTTKRTCLIFGVSIGLDPARNAQKEFLIGQSSRSHVTYRRPSLDMASSFCIVISPHSQRCKQRTVDAALLQISQIAWSVCLCVFVNRHVTMSCAKTVKPIEMLFIFIRVFS